MVSQLRHSYEEQREQRGHYWNKSRAEKGLANSRRRSHLHETGPTNISPRKKEGLVRCPLPKIYL